MLISPWAQFSSLFEFGVRFEQVNESVVTIPHCRNYLPPGYCSLLLTSLVVALPQTDHSSWDSLLFNLKQKIIPAYSVQMQLLNHNFPAIVPDKH